MPSTGDVLFTHANVTRAMRELGYHPATDLTAGLLSFVQWYKQFYAAGSSNRDALASYKPY